jgi:hypothetical protein
MVSSRCIGIDIGRTIKLVELCGAAGRPCVDAARTRSTAGAGPGSGPADWG